METAAANSEQQNPPLGMNGYKEDSREFDPLTQVTTQMLEPFLDGDMYSKSRGAIVEDGDDLGQVSP